MMSASADIRSGAEAPVVEIKGRMLTVNTARLAGDEASAMTDSVARRLRDLPTMLRGMPLVLVVESPALDVTAVIEGLRTEGIYPAAISNATPEQERQAAALAVAAVRLGSAARPAKSSDSEQAADFSSRDAEPVEKPAQSPSAAPTMVIDKPVRSGQQVYAKGGDLIVASQVSAGAEVIADGSIHVYGALRGRALAGVQGDTTARIFCTQLGAELVAIAGHYQVAEDMESRHLGRAVQVRLVEEKLIIERQGK